MKLLVLELEKINPHSKRPYQLFIESFETLTVYVNREFTVQVSVEQFYTLKGNILVDLRDQGHGPHEVVTSAHAIDEIDLEIPL